jgi:hypothetical protein
MTPGTKVDYTAIFPSVTPSHKACTSSNTIHRPSHCPAHLFSYMPLMELLQHIDSPSAVQGLQSLIHSYWNGTWAVTFSWIPGNLCISGNTAADNAVRYATLQGTSMPGFQAQILELSFISPFLLNGKGTHNTQGNKLWEVNPVVHSWRSTSCPIHWDEVVVTRLWTSCHTRLTPRHPPSMCAPQCPMHFSWLVSGH